MSDVTRADIKTMIYAAVDETVDTLCDIIGIPDIDRVEELAAELYEVSWPGAPHQTVQAREAYRRLARHVIRENEWRGDLIQENQRLRIELAAERGDVKF